jgi:hypothetical protein
MPLPYYSSARGKRALGCAEPRSARGAHFAVGESLEIGIDRCPNLRPISATQCVQVPSAVSAPGGRSRSGTRPIDAPVTRCVPTAAAACASGALRQISPPSSWRLLRTTLGARTLSKLRLPGRDEVVHKYGLRLRLEDDINPIPEAQTTNHGVLHAFGALCGSFEAKRLQSLRQDFR